MEYGSAGCRKRLGGVQALRGVDLDIQPRRVTAVVGESGCGKSTLLEHVNGLLRPDTGEVLVAGAPIPADGLVEFRREIGYAVQGIGLFPHLSVFDNVTLVARMALWPEERIAERFEHLLEMFELSPDFAERYALELSGGQQQRVGLARAFMMAPSIVLLDEPFSAVDPITRRGIHLRFQAMQHAEPATVILVTHDMNEARMLGDDLVILRDGAVAQVGSVAAVLNEPNSDYVAQLVAQQLTSGVDDGGGDA